MNHILRCAETSWAILAHLLERYDASEPHFLLLTALVFQRQVLEPSQNPVMKDGVVHSHAWLQVRSHVSKDSHPYRVEVPADPGPQSRYVQVAYSMGLQ